jgi:hypothetical protein
MFNRRALIALLLTFALAALAASFPGYAAAQGITIPTPTDEPSPGDPDPQPTDDNGGSPNPTSEPAPPDGPNPTSQPNPTDSPPQATAPSSSATPPPVAVTPATVRPSATATTAGPAIVLTATPSATSFSVVPGATDGTLVPAAPSAGSATPAGTVLDGAILTFPEGSVNYPEAGPCDIPPTYKANESMTVFVGPGSEYPLAGLLGPGEVRPIVGRAAFSAWWVVQLDGSGRAGWVRDELGSVSGYIRRVPILSAPALNGVLPTPGGSPWVPVPAAACSAPEIAAGAAVAAAPRDDVQPPSGRPDSPDGLEDGAVNGAQSEAEAEAAQPLVTLPDSAGGEGEVVLTEGEISSPSLAGDLAKQAAPLELLGAQSQQLPNLMPIAGTVLIAAALVVGVFAFLRRSDEGS